ncbi:MAG: hypothetical protein Q9212_004368 [Teloschistes hypoglaucus]
MASSSVILQPPPSTKPASSLSNGQLSAQPVFDYTNQAMTSGSESDLSEAMDPPNTMLASPPLHLTKNGIHKMKGSIGSESSPDEDAMGSDDAEYDIEDTLPPTIQLSAPEMRSTSEPSTTSSKRKASLEDDDYMLNDPELYGLRRSVESDSDSGSDIESRPRKRPRIAASSQGSKPVSSSTQSDADSALEPEFSKPSRPRLSAPKKRQRRLQQSTVATPPPHADVRFSTRQAAKVSNYNEDNDDMFDDEEDIQYEWVTAPDGYIPQVDQILKHRLREDTSMATAVIGEAINADHSVGKEASELDKQDFEYFIKWQGKAHYHATWEPYGSLLAYKGQRKAENYFNKKIIEDIRLERGEDMSPDEKESRLLQRESDNSQVDENTKVERIISMREDDDDNIEYYVKWKRVPYQECTWEEAGLISRIAQSEIDRYLDRTASLPVSGKPSKIAEQFKEQPHYIKNGTLRDFQKLGINFMALNWQRHRSVILADEMGLGKTVQTVAFLNWLRHDRLQQGPFLVVVPLSTMPSWAETFDHWTPDINYVIYNGREASRNIIKEYELFTDGKRPQPKFHVLLTTYEYITIDAGYLSQIKWQFMAVDEAHRLKSRQSQLYTKLLEFKAPHKLLITGTPVQNDLSELSALLHFLNPNDPEADINIDFLQPDEAGRKLQRLIETLGPIMIRRTKKTVEKDLPPKTEKIIRVELSDVQLEYYKNILTRNYAALNDGAKGPKQSLLNIMMELKKASNHPFIFPNAEARIVGDKTGHEEIFKALVTSSGKLMLLDGLLKKLHKNGHRVLIFSQMVKMLDILQDYMKYRGYQFQRLDGTIPSAQRTQAMEHFNKPDSPDFCFLLSTRAGGLGINLMTADTVILFDSDWNPQADLQAMARAHRIGQTKPVSIFRLVAKETIEEEVLERARNKLMLEHITIERGVTDKESNDKLQDKLAKVKKGSDAPSSSEDISRILKRRGQKMFEQSSNQKRLEELDIDSVLENAEEHQTEEDKRLTGDGGEDFLKKFEYTDVKLDLEWDQIIPKEAIAEIKAAEEKKAHQKFLDDQIQQNAPRKRKNESSDRDERAAKKRALQNNVNEASNESDSVEDRDPKRPLSTRETRDLIKAYLRWGWIEDERGEDVIKDARLTGRNHDVLKTHLQHILDLAASEKQKNDANIKEQELATGKLVPQKDRKSAVFEFNGTKRNNATTIHERIEHMRLLRKAVKDVPNELSFRIPEAQKGNDFTTSWGSLEDGMLCIGIVRHGYGAWPQIRDDPDLGLGDKLFLEEQRVEKKEQRRNAEKQSSKTPQAVHLVRRISYLLSVLEDKMNGSQNPAAKRAVENHHRNNKKNGLHPKGNGRLGASASPAPQSAPKRQREAEKHRPRHGTPHRIPKIDTNGHIAARPRSTSQRSPPIDPMSSRTSGNSAATHGPGAKLLLFPVRKNLEALKLATKSNQPDNTARATTLRQHLGTIGDYVMEMLTASDYAPEDIMALEWTLWEYVQASWPTDKTKTSKIRSMWRRLKGLDDDGLAPPAEAEAVMATNGQSNGASIRPTTV